MKKITPYRHGDVDIIPVEGIPDGAKKIQSGKNITLALGEVTGHSHTLVVDTDVELYELDGAKYINLPKEAILSHQEHNTITIAPNVYKIVIEQEYDYFELGLRRVQD